MYICARLCYMAVGAKEEIDGIGDVHGEIEQSERQSSLSLMTYIHTGI